MNKKYLVVPMILFVALGMTGLTYATWYKYLYINGQVDTGTLCLEYIGSSFFQKDQGNDWTCETHNLDNAWQLTKDVGSTTGDFIDQDGDGCLDTLILTASNVYPCYYNEISVRIHNCGTIPLHIMGVVIDWNGQTIILPNGQLVILYDEAGNEVIELRYLDHAGMQMHPSQTIEDSFDFHILQPAKMGHQYTFTIRFVYAQWNTQETLQDLIGN